jgi:electron transfer flavoprotein alpha subunit
MKKVCIFQGIESHKTALGLLEVPRRLYGDKKFQSYVVSLKDPVDLLNGFFHHIINLSEDIVEDFNARGVCDILFNLHKKYHFDTIVIPDTSLGRMVAPRLAKRLKTGLVSGVVDIQKSGNTIEFMRPALSGKIVETVQFKPNRLILITAKPNIFDNTSDGGLRSKIIEYTGPEPLKSNIKRLNVEENQVKEDISEAQVLISGGGGVKDHFSTLYPLAEALNGSVSATRKLVDQGIAPRNLQVGLSGKTVSPKMYIALGIHGTLQHMAGLRGGESIISVNTNCHAPICHVSDIVVHGDAVEFIDRMMKKINEYRSDDKGN